MDTPRPYSQRKLRDGTILREFRSDARSEELVWHQDRQHRSARVIESGGWMLQLEEGLPFPLVEGNTYEIPARSWHRVLRGPGKLKIEIQEGNTMRITESQLRRIVREEARRLLESVVDLEKDSTTRSWLSQFTANPKDTELHADLVKAWDEMCKMAPNLTLSPPSSSNIKNAVDKISAATKLSRSLISFHIQGVKRLIDAGACPSGAAFAEAFEEYKASRPARAPTATGPDFYPMAGGGKVSAKPGEPRGSQELFDTADEAYSSLFYPDIGPDSWRVFKDPNTGKYWAIGEYDTYGT